MNDAWLMAPITPPPLIEEEDKFKFYGYIIGLWIVPDWNDSDNLDGSLYALFEYNSERTLYRVPDEELFKILTGHLYSMAWIRKNTDEYGYDKLWIKKEAGKWEVELP